jgi:hypothetical protein
LKGISHYRVAYILIMVFMFYMSNLLIFNVSKINEDIIDRRQSEPTGPAGPNGQLPSDAVEITVEDAIYMQQGRNMKRRTATGVQVQAKKKK